MRYSRFLILAWVLFATRSIYSWQILGDLKASTGLGIFDHPSAPPSDLSSRISINHRKINGKISKQIGPHFQISLLGEFREKNFSFLLRGELNQISTLHSSADIFSATHVKSTLEAGGRYHFDLGRNWELSLKASLSFSLNQFRDLHLNTSIPKLGFENQISLKWKRVQLGHSLFIPFFSSYVLKADKEIASSSQKSQGLALRTNLEILLSKRFTLFLEADLEHFEIKRTLSQERSPHSLLLMPLESEEEKIILESSHFSLGIKINF